MWRWLRAAASRQSSPRHTRIPCTWWMASFTMAWPTCRAAYRAPRRSGSRTPPSPTRSAWPGAAGSKPARTTRRCSSASTWSRGRWCIPRSPRRSVYHQRIPGPSCEGKAMTERKTLAILVGGGPAPGINSVIGAATIRARLEAVDVLGVRDGFEWIMQGDIDHVTPLDIGEVSRIHFRGGSYIGISRANPTKDPKHLDNAVLALLRLNVSQLITIGGDDTAYSAMKLEEKAAGRLQVVHVPKTIDNDLDLPPHVDTFGFQTARHYGVEIVKNLMVDAKTTSRWYLVITMGRGAGHLAMGIGKAAGATLTLIPEEFPGQRIRLKAVVDTLVGAVIKRLSYGRLDGVAVVAEGLALGIDPADLAGFEEVERDTHGNVRIAEVNIGEILKAAVQKRLKEFGLQATIAAKNIGYELRCADPIPMDMEYTRDLGYCAAKYVLGGGTAAMISLQAGRFVPIPFAAMMDAATGRTRTRRVDITSTRYAIARRYMIRLRRDDFEDPHELARFAATAHVSVEEFRRQFERLIEEEPPPLVLDSVGERDPGALA